MHLKHLDIFADLCIKHGLALFEKKTSLLQEKIDFLGMKIDGKGIELESHILEKITAFPNKLVDKKQVQSRYFPKYFVGSKLITQVSYDPVNNTEEAIDKWETAFRIAVSVNKMDIETIKGFLERTLLNSAFWNIIQKNH